MTLQTYGTDNFTSGGRGTPNALSPASDGQNWVVATGTATMAQPTLSGQKRGQLTSVDTNITVLDLGANQWTDVDLAVRLSYSNTGAKIGPMGRSSASNTYYRATVSGNTLEILRSKAGATTSIATLTLTGPQTPAANGYFWIHFRIQGFGSTGSNQNNLMASMWLDGGSEPSNWMLTARDNVETTTAALYLPGNFGVLFKPSAIGQTATFDSFTCTDCPPPANVPAYNVAHTNPYGVTIYVPNTNTPPLSPQQVIDLIGTCSLGTNPASATGWGNGSTLRYQQRLVNWELVNGFYDWGIMDDAVQKANYWGFRIMWPVQAPPAWQKTRDALGSNMSLQAATQGSGTNYSAANAPVGGYTQINVTGLPSGAYIPHKSQISINWGNGTAEIVYVWNPNATYTQGTTKIGISTTAGTQTGWTPASTHVVGEAIWEATSGGTGGPQWGNANYYATVCALIAARYNGLSGYGKLDGMQIENEDYDAAQHIGPQGAYGTGNSTPGYTNPAYVWDGSSTWDNGGAILAPVYYKARKAIKAIPGMANCPVFPCAVRKPPNTARQHVINWVTGFILQIIALGGSVDGLDAHYYRGGTTDWDGTLILDPSISTYVDSANQYVNTPAIDVEVADLKALLAKYGFNNALVLFGETGFDIYDDGAGPKTTLTAARNHGTTYTTLPVTTGWTNTANIPDTSPIYVDWDNTGLSEVVYAFGTATKDATTIQITTNSLGSGATQTAWNPTNSHANGATVYGYITTVTVPVGDNAGATVGTQSNYIRKMYNKMRLAGADMCLVYTMAPDSSIVHTTTSPQWSETPKGVTQNISGVHTYEPAYYLTATQAALYPDGWKSSGGPPPPPPPTTGIVIAAINRRSGQAPSVSRRDGTGPSTSRRG